MIIEYINIFSNLTQHKENEVVEFKKAENSFDFDDLGKYFSALSNEANLRGLDFAWLIFGYDEKKHEIVGTSYKNGDTGDQLFLSGICTESSSHAASLPAHSAVPTSASPS